MVQLLDESDEVAELGDGYRRDRVNRGWSNVTWQCPGFRRSPLKFVQDRLVSIVLMSNFFGSAY
jgi:hypothetical protein